MALPRADSHASHELIAHRLSLLMEEQRASNTIPAKAPTLFPDAKYFFNLLGSFDFRRFEAISAF